MGDHEGWVKPPSGLLPNGLLPHEAAIGLQVLDSERWLKAEERTAELIACIQPNAPTEERRNAVADYVKRLIMKCFPCQVFTFGSVPLKTYLPDGDIDLTAFSENQNLKDTWAHQVRNMLENEEKNENAEFRVKEVQYIQAEVKIIKCLVENIVVDISFNQLGGLCTLCFLEEVDHLINHNYLFKRSIILIKAWCYYESRILGAHHGLISTYALEALVLYMFHVYNNSFSGPLEVLYRFLEFFSKFDWDNFCVSLWGPVPISSLPDITAKPPRRDGGDLLLSKEFLETRSSIYAVFPGGQESQGQPFVSKHFNVIDPLRVNNNLGRSVSKGNFFRIRSAFAFGAKRLARLLECPEEDLLLEINQFFMNTWERHGSGHRPDAPSNDLCHSRLPPSELFNESENLKNKSSNRKNDVLSSRENQDECVRQSHGLTSRQSHSLLESTSKQNDFSTSTRMQAQSSEGDHNNSKFDQSRKEINANQSATNKNQQSSVNDIRGRLFFARTRSSPELTDAYGEVSSLVKRNKAQENVKTQTSLRMDSSGRKKSESSALAHHSTRASTDFPSTNFPSTTRHVSSRNNLDAVADVNNFRDDLESSAAVDDFSPLVGTKGIHEEKQDPVNLVGSSVGHDFNGPVNIPLNIASGHLQFPISPSVLDSMGFGQRNFSGMVPANVPLIETPWGANVHFPRGLDSSPLNHYISSMGLNSRVENHVESINEKFSCVERSSREADDEFWHEQDRNSIGRFDIDNGSLEMPRPDDKLQSTSGTLNFSPSRRNQPGNYKRVQQKFTKENRVLISDEHATHFKYQNNTRNEIHLDDRTASSRSSPVALTSGGRSKTSSESSWDGSSAKVSKSVREKRGRKTTYLVVPSSAHGKGRSGSEQLFSQTDEENKESESSGPQSVSSLHVPRVEVPGYEMAQPSGSEPVLPLGPVLLGPPSQQRGIDNSGAVPFSFYPTGPPVPFVAMLPFYNFLADGTTDVSTSHFGVDELADSDSGPKFDTSVRHDLPEFLSTISPRIATSIEPADRKGDILNSDFPSHLQNLQYGRFCQNSRSPSVVSPSPMVVPPMYLQGHYQWDGPGRPLSGNMNPISLGYGSRVVPVPPFQSVSNRPTIVYQRYADEMPRYRSGTGTYLPNPKVAAVRDRHSANGRQGHYSVGDHHSDKEDNWNVAKSRGAGRSHGRNQAEKANSRVDRMTASENRAERPWGSRHVSHPSYKSQSGPFHHSNSNRSSSSTLAYGMYPLPGLNPNSLSSNGPNIPSVVMLYPYDHNTGYAPTTEQLEFGSLGPIGFSSINDASQLNEVSRMGSAFDDQRFRGSPAQQSPPDQPSSPNYSR